MPFDKISPSQMKVMRIITGLFFMTVGGALAFLGAGQILDPAAVSRFTGTAAAVYPFAALQQGVLLAVAGLMLVELTTSPPFKMSINVPFVAANFQVALSFGIIGAALSIKHALMPGDVSGGVAALQVLCIAGCLMNLMFVVMTKMHWNFTENTGKELPKA